MDRLLGMYVHTHWSYNQPYAARTWTLGHWKGYLTGLSRMGYNLVQIWPMLDTMPVPPTPSDLAHLDKLRRVIRYAHDELGMTVYVGIGPNTSANEHAASFSFEDRNYFEAEVLVNSSDEAAMDREMERRRALLEPLSEADGLWVLDCDPGGCVGSPVSDFVDILLRHRDMLDRLRPGIRLVYWMWAGWTDKHRFDPEWTGNAQSCWVEVLQSLKRLNPEPWALHACMPGHFKSIEQVGVVERTHFYPYNLVEYEPSYPFTNWEPKRIADAFAAFSQYSYPMGALGNSQTHCVQIPHAYVFSHIARGGSLDDLDPAVFGERLIPGHGEGLAQAWRAMSIETDDPAVPRSAIEPIQGLLHAPNIATGDLEGLFFGSPRRYLEDLALQLGLWSEILTLKHAGKSPERLRRALRSVVDALVAWNARHGFRDRYDDVYYYGHAHPIFRDAFAALGTPEAEAVLDRLDMLSGRSHGQTTALLDAMRRAVV